MIDEQDEPRYAILWIGVRQLTSILLDLSEGKMPTRFILPPDAKVVAVTADWCRNSIGVKLWSRHFQVVPDGCETPSICTELIQAEQAEPNVVVDLNDEGFTIQRPPNGIEAQHLEGNMSNVPTREELRERARRYGWSGDYVVVEEFVRDLYGEAGLEPGDLEPYDKS